MVGVNRGGVGVIVVHDRYAEARLERAPDVELVPAGVPEVGRAPGGEDPGGAGGPRGVQADREHLLPWHAGHGEHLVELVDQRLDRLVRAFADETGQLRHRVHEEPAVRGKNGAIVRRTAIVDTNGYPVTRYEHEPSPASHCTEEGISQVER